MVLGTYRIGVNYLAASTFISYYYVHQLGKALVEPHFKRKIIPDYQVFCI